MDKLSMHVCATVAPFQEPSADAMGVGEVWGLWSLGRWVRPRSGTNAGMRVWEDGNRSARLFTMDKRGMMVLSTWNGSVDEDCEMAFRVRL